MERDLFGNTCLGRSHRDCVSRGIMDVSQGPRVRWFSSGKSKSVSQSESGTRWNQAFMDALAANAPHVTYSNTQSGAKVTDPNDPTQFTVGIPKFHGLEDMDFDKLQKGLYQRQMQDIDPAYQNARAQTREELSQSGLLNSPVQYGKGGAIDQLEQNYLSQAQKAATDASNKTVELKQQELARKTGWDMDTVKLVQAILQQYYEVALRSGAFGSSSSSSSASNFGFQGPTLSFT